MEEDIGNAQGAEEGPLGVVGKKYVVSYVKIIRVFVVHVNFFKFISYFLKSTSGNILLVE